MRPTNVHTHLFCLDDIPNDFINLYVSNNLFSGIVNKFVRTKAGMLALAGFKFFQKKNSMLNRFITISEAGRFADSSKLYHLLKDRYDQQDFRFVSLTLNLDHIGGGNSRIFNSQLENVIITKKKAEDPSGLLLFLSLDPRSYNNGLEMLEDIKSRFETKIPGTQYYPFCGLKIYPSTGYFVFDKKLKPTFEWAAENEIPIMSHNYYQGGIYLNNMSSIKSIFSNACDVYTGKQYTGPGYIEMRKKIFGRLWGKERNDSNMVSSSYFMEPESYRTMLTYFRDVIKKPLKLCFAHFGGLKQMRLHNGDTSVKEELQINPVGISKSNWHTQILNLIKEFDGVYTDVSYMTSEFDYNKKDYWQFIVKYLNNLDYTNKILFGTDFYLADKGKLGEQDVYHMFKEVAIKTTLTNKNTMWQQLTDINTNFYLKNPFL